ncbi:imelysin family protein [Pendulispora rubella]|uniref:Imelysin family protein n=1 Tax=Pendulispora rubella TaxID=2741070 RepID=A0ABZ2KWC1_9BACT
MPSFRRVAWAVAACVASVGLAVLGANAGCRKAPPDENVYTGSGGAKPPPSGTTPDSGDFDKRALLQAAGECAVGRYRDFEGSARALRDAAAAWRDDPSDVRRDAARDAWRAAMAAWEQAEVFRVGPAARSSEPGGKNLRDQIYSWSLFHRCTIEEQLVDETYARPEFATTLISTRGLGGFEFLAFYGGTDNACPGGSPINALGSWNRLGPEEIGRRKARYAAAIADNIGGHVATLLAAWDPGGGNFLNELVAAGAGSATFGTNQDAFNALSAALFYVEMEVKDEKLGKPLGLNDCTRGRCPEAVESPYARISKENIKANLIGFRRLFQGCGENGAGLGFDDWLRAVGASDLSDRMIAALATAQAAVDALAGMSLEQALESAPAKVEALYGAVKTLTDLLKTEFITVLNLELPKGSEGDND